MTYVEQRSNLAGNVSHRTQSVSAAAPWTDGLMLLMSPVPGACASASSGTRADDCRSSRPPRSRASRRRPAPGRKNVISTICVHLRRRASCSAAAVAVRVCPDRSFDSQRSPGGTFRTMGSHQARARVLPGRSGESGRIQQADACAPHARGAGKVAFVLFSESTSGTRRPSAEDGQRQRRRDCSACRLR